ncbi:putative type II secretion system protein J [Leptospira inadai serovar Lyme str. 10]|uniref:Type II secretion system protein J n=2 Tax=Leptospira inadai serovar Lyme TaxID=293084 RepID=V6HEH4_9LEPT|nr:type II secretion system protein GspJ [Leptospira inadai]EQA37743.1 putative type II secretion system protein J [Leptospira inadai serovar Lyme str. 10]PNV76315.1 prepilin-type N-terminal cleavage/methylation domain-containing protein [Leptospira inadai serovar Lyme]
MARARNLRLPGFFFAKKRQFRRGFTLLELSIVAMLLGGLLVMIFGTYTSLLRVSRDNSSVEGGDKQQAMSALENIRSTLAMTFFFATEKRLVFVSRRGRKSEDGNKHPRESSNDYFIVFAAAHPNSEETGLPEVREVEYFLKKDEDAPGYLLIRREDQIVDKFPFAGGQEYTLLNGVKSLAFKFSRTGSKWEEEWDSREAKNIPRLIRIELIAKIGTEERRFETLAFPGILYK